MPDLTDQLSIVDPASLDHDRDNVVIVDVREERTYREVGHVPGAVSIPYERFRDPGSVSTGKLPDPEEIEATLRDRGISPTDTIVAYDADTGVYAARFLLTAGVFGHEGDLQLLDGGFEAWQSVGEVDRGPVQREPSAYRIQDQSPAIADRAAVESAVEDESNDITLVDTRTAAEYNHSHIPGAVHLGWEQFVDDGRLKSRDAVESILDEKGLDPDARIILYCNTARRLSHTFVVLAHLGYTDLRFYEGSLTDWVRAKSPKWDPQQLAADVRSVADQGFDALPEALGDDIFSRLHLVGLYTQKQDGYFMVRTKVPGGRLTAEQARTFGEVADEFARAPPDHGGEHQNPEFGDGFLDVTTRQGLQLHWVRLEDVPEIWDRFEDVGLTTVQASGNTLRNVVCCPAAGLGDEILDVRKLAADIADAFEGNKRYANLPRKLKVSLAGCHENCGRAEIQDLGFTPAVKDGRDGFHVAVGGGLSDGPRAATDLDIFVPPEKVVELTLAAADLFIDHGSYLDTAVNRLKFIVEEWGVDRFRSELEGYVDFEFESPGEDLTTCYRGDHVGVHAQADGENYVGVNVPTGRIRGDEFVDLANIAEQYGSGEIRTTPNQNLVVAGVPDDALDGLLDEPQLSEYSPSPGPFSRGVVTCTGAEFCSYGVVETKNRAIQWARDLDSWLDESDALADDALPDAVRIHMSGCSASCAQPQIGDIGLRGERHRGPEAEVPAADVGLGGDLSQGSFIDWVAGSVPLEQIPEAIKTLVEAYESEQTDQHSFSDWLQKTPDPTLREYLAGSNTPATEQPSAEVHPQ